MALPSQKIKELCDTASLLTPFVDSSLTACAYKVRMLNAYQPVTGECWQPTGDALRYRLGPAELVLVETVEYIRMPVNLCATYSPDHDLARQGLLLVNPSLIEPAYSGPLSCVLVNVSAEPILLRRNQEVAKLCFHVLDPSPDRLVSEEIDREEYQHLLAEQALKFRVSYLDVLGLERRAAKRAQRALKSWVIGGGILVGMLVLWASLEPMFSHWLWHRTGVLSTTQREKDSVLLERLETTKVILDLRKEMIDLKEELRKKPLPPASEPGAVLPGP